MRSSIRRVVQLLSDHPIFVSISLFALPLLLIIPIKSLLIDLMIQHRLDNHLSKLAVIMASHNDELNQANFEHLKKLFHFSCDMHDIELLASEKLSPREVRVIQLELANGKRCSNLGEAVDMKLSHDRLQHKSGAILTTSHAESHENRSLVYILPLNNNRLVAMINNRIYSDQLNNHCNHCFQLEIKYPNLKPIQLGQTTLEQLNHQYKASHLVVNGNLLLTLKAGDLLNMEIAKQFWFWISIASLSFGVISNLLFSHWRNMRISQGYLIRKGIENREFVPFYQPIYDIQTNKIVGQEALLRCNGLTGL
ncbi:EAL domain-containing protein [Shewanella marina]|uniref:EAL domain-containing protein n=1 Tax=Shewanella marina TaxID=487319 RepID=UPI00068782FC|nr:EAL domain-containing protein [Shewanella marina]